MKTVLAALLSLFCLMAPLANAEPSTGSIDVHWDPGSADCQGHPPRPLQVHRYDERTYILRESLCQTYEGPFIYLLIGSSKALLIDSGDVADASKAPLAATVIALLPQVNGARMPLEVVHTHSHLDHRAGDVQFAGLPQVTVVGADLPHVIQTFGFRHWPDDVAQVDLGDRVVDVIPTPGHTPSHVSYYDRSTGLVFSGDFFLPGRLIIDDVDADRASARRLLDFLGNRPVSYILGGHIELDRHGQPEPMGSNFHPDERPLPLDMADLRKLPAMLAGFNGIYGQSGEYVMYSQARMLQLMAAAALLLLAIITLTLVWWLRHRRRRRADPALATSLPT
ncbi:MBL fold metallo-hydrolase [Dyella solisilvae]|uniref:MBL fold metallo-hydrolase n=1 Tax=Dyella solisilvae TaxID=1920168 RepID=A0A370K9V2_9GAMM|nr:MBL fold metallo-hydrolase [Dyella solisilvae]RDI99433.1 MBL fold metallo-hydrolase [Dyella solisilvae]